MSVDACCLKGFEWSGTPSGREDKLGDLDAYVAGSSADIAIVLFADLLGWRFRNTRLLADHYASEVGATVYVPDLYEGDILEAEPIINNDWRHVPIAAWMRRNSRQARDPNVLACGRALGTYRKVAAVGFCYGGWAAWRLASADHPAPLVDCICVGHPSLLETADIDKTSVPTLVLAPEHDPVFTKELKLHTFQKLQELDIPFSYQHFPGVEHACLIRGDERKDGEREAMARGKNAAVAWLKQFLLE